MIDKNVSPDISDQAAAENVSTAWTSGTQIVLGASLAHPRRKLVIFSETCFCNWYLLQLTILLYKRRSRNLIVLYSVIEIEKFRFECNFCWGEDMKRIGIMKCRPNPPFFKIYFLNLDTDQNGWEFLKLGVNLSMGFFSFSLFPSSSSSPFPLSLAIHWEDSSANSMSIQEILTFRETQNVTKRLRGGQM